MSEVASAASWQIPGNPDPQNLISPGSAGPDPILPAGFAHHTPTLFFNTYRQISS